ncbi:MAG: nitroreductase family protein, partial [Nitrososphaeraceae archaeon]
LIMHEMGGFDVQKAIEIFKISEAFEIGVMIAIGYQDKHSVLPERFREKVYSPRERRELSEIAFVEEIGKSLQ